MALTLGSGCQQPTSIHTKDLSGTWKAQTSPWTITLDRQGRVQSARIPLGDVEIKPHQTTRVPMKDGSVSSWRAGPCTAEYNHDIRELSITIVIEKFHINYKNNNLTGHQWNLLTGMVSPDGTTWTPDWINMSDYGPRFPQDTNDMYVEKLKFQKIPAHKEI
jgi:hypothetical protein